MPAAVKQNLENHADELRQITIHRARKRDKYAKTTHMNFGSQMEKLLR